MMIAERVSPPDETRVNAPFTPIGVESFCYR